MTAAALRGDWDSFREGDWMQTQSGLRFFPLDPRPRDFDITDIAHALSMLCRYNGHVDQFYSVAEHCVLISQAVRPEYALDGLMHAAAEAYVGDMIRPLKVNIGQYKAIEDGILYVLAGRFGTTWPIPEEVHEASNRILLTERAALLRNTSHAWDPYLESLDPLDVEIQGWAPAEAKAEFLARFEEVSGR
jgi:uncharacterized protein